ncbi:MAG TPA: D-alanyl-D-alanine carboxypeptidase family protein [Actinomycetota bacterium]|nr:D-alanyl-D-alanine carboxypeptidase family protein [Actinomycetota bacterium]
MRRLPAPFVVLAVLAAVLTAGPAALAAPRTQPLPAAVVTPKPQPQPAPEPPPPTIVPVPCPSGQSGTCTSPSPFPTKLETPTPSVQAPDVTAEAAIVEDLATGQVLYTKNPDTERSLASTTKIMTALLTLERAKPKDIVTVGADAAEQGSVGAGFSELGLQEGEQLSVQDLLYALMLQSSNDAAIALADHVSGSVDAFVQAMNARAKSLGLTHTVFYSPNGLDDRGHSTAREMAAITREAMATKGFAQIVRQKFDTIPAPSGPDRQVQNRNVLLWLYRGANGVKTGYTSAAGFCLVATATRDGRGVVAVVLGSPSTEDSFDDAAALLDYGFTGYAIHTFVKAGQAFDPLPVGTQRLPVEASAGLQRLLQEPAGKVQRRIAILPGLAPPIEAGQRVGTVTFSAAGRDVGSVPLVASGRLETADTAGTSGEGTAWWLRGLSSIAGFGLGTLFGLFG